MVRALVFFLILTGCTLNYRGNEQDYDIDAVMESEHCKVMIKRKEVKTEKKVDADGKSSTATP